LRIVWGFSLDFIIRYLDLLISIIISIIIMVFIFIYVIYGCRHAARLNTQRVIGLGRLIGIAN